jgi:hypothetical protein
MILLNFVAHHFTCTPIFNRQILFGHRPRRGPYWQIYAHYQAYDGNWM